MSKYDPLTKRLAAAKGAEWKVSFTELEKLLGAPLPKAARSGGAWWKAEAATPQAKAWAGWTPEVGEESVVFRRVETPAAAAKAIMPVTPGDDTPPILKRLEVSPGWGMALVAGGVAIVAGIGALALRGFARRGKAD